MIKLFDNYGVVVDEYNYMLVRYLKDRTRANGKTEAVYDYLGYYSSLGEAIKGLRDKCIRWELQKGSPDLPTALTTIKNCNARFEQLLREKCGEERSEK